MNIVITGASSSIGLALIKEFDKKSNYVWAQYNKSSPEDMLRDIKNPDLFNMMSADLCDYIQLENFTDDIFCSDKQVDTLIHLPSAKLNISPFERIKWSNFEQQINIQVRSLHVLVSKLKKQILRSENRKIIVCGSEVTEGDPPSGMIDYVTTKGMLKYYCEALSKELYSKQVSIHYISPGMFRSNLLSNIPEYIIEKYCLHRDQNSIQNEIIPLIISYINTPR